MPTPVTAARPPSNLALRLAATRQTPDVCGRARTLFGQVRSVHRAALYVEQLAADRQLVVAIDDVGGLPGGVLVAGVSDLRGTGIRRGMAVVPSPAGLAIPAAHVEIDLSRAATWSPTLPAAARFGPAMEPARIAAARRLASELAPAGGLGPMLSRTAGSGGPWDPWQDRARALVAAQLRALDAGDAATAIGPTIDLIGLGIGLTPSGDDYLVGLLAGLEAAADPALPSLAAAIAAHASGRTTAIGAAALGHAAAGAFSERLHDVVVALAGGALDDLDTPIRRAMAYGATSGADILVGLFAAVDLALDHSARNPLAAA